MKLDIHYDNGSVVTLVEKTPPTPPIQYYRWPHDIERRANTDDPTFMGAGYRSGPIRGAVVNNNKPLPEVYRLLPDQTTPLYDWAIKLWRDLNDDLDDDHFCTLLDNHLWLTNGTGWPGRRNIIKGVDLTKGWPTFHAPLVTGGAIFRGVETDGGRLVIANIRYNEPVTKEYVLARPWLWFYGTAIAPSGQINYIVRKSRTTGQMIPVKVPFITKYPVYIPMAWVHKLEPGFIPPAANWLP